MRIEEYIGYRIQELCHKHSITKYRLSQLTGISQTALANIISKQSIPTILTLERICDAFGITLAQFFARGSERPDLTDNQLEILETWDKLDTKEREILITFIRSLKR